MPENVFLFLVKGIQGTQPPGQNYIPLPAANLAKLRLRTNQGVYMLHFTKNEDDRGLCGMCLSVRMSF